MLLNYCPIMGLVGWEIILPEIKGKIYLERNNPSRRINRFGKRRLYSRKILFRWIVLKNGGSPIIRLPPLFFKWFFEKESKRRDKNIYTTNIQWQFS